MENQMMFGGAVTRKVIRAQAKTAGWRWKLKNIPHRLRGWRFYAGQILGFGGFYAELRAVLRRADGTVVDYGVLGTRVVTTAFCELMVDQLQTETSVWGDFKYHDSGVGNTAEANGDTGIETTDGEDRVAGTQTEGTSVQYQSVGTIAYTTTKAIVEHGLFNTSDSATLMDRTVFSAINVVDGDSIEFTYTLTCTAGG